MSIATNNNEQFDTDCVSQNEALSHVNEATVMYFSNKFEECEHFLRSKMVTNPDFTHTYSHGLAVVKTVMALFTNEKVSSSDYHHLYDE